ncbi:uncharacterized protein LOC143462279 isoform X1 [Clavelina lepadiformis]|uniref:uncharacterized protein LOC143462279 isoform X1 n=1 Tax=Clavelina lepadiformis TaxID=159417 RepID=UPI004041274A
MNYDSCDRPSSRVSRPPGGCSSNIFGDPTPVNAPVKTSRNPSYQSSVFATDTPAEPAIKPKPEARKVPLSNIPMFITDRPSTAPCPRRCVSKTMQSSVFSDLNYPVNPKYELGFKQRPKTAFKPATPTIKSSIFAREKISEKSATKKKCSLTHQSSIFKPPPKLSVRNVPASKTFTCTMHDEITVEPFLTKKKSKDSNLSIMDGSACEVTGSPILVSSDTKQSQIKYRQRNRNPPSTGEVNRSTANLIYSKSKIPVKLHQKKIVRESSTTSLITGTEAEVPPLYTSDDKISCVRSVKRSQEREQPRIFSNLPPQQAPLFSTGFLSAPLTKRSSHSSKQSSSQVLP